MAFWTFRSDADAPSPAVGSRRPDSEARQDLIAWFVCCSAWFDQLLSEPVAYHLLERQLELLIVAKVVEDHLQIADFLLQGEHPATHLRYLLVVLTGDVEVCLAERPGPRVIDIPHQVGAQSFLVLKQLLQDGVTLPETLLEFEQA
jgi:hypothetical protein